MGSTHIAQLPAVLEALPGVRLQLDLFDHQLLRWGVALPDAASVEARAVLRTAPNGLNARDGLLQGGKKQAVLGAVADYLQAKGESIGKREAP